MVPWTVEEKILRKERRRHLRGFEEAGEGAKQKRRKKEEVPETRALAKTKSPPEIKRSPEYRHSPEGRAGEVDLYADLDFGTEPPARILDPKLSTRVIQDCADLDFDRDTSGKPAILGDFGITQKDVSSAYRRREKPPDQVPLPPPKRPRSPSPEGLQTSKRMKRDYYEVVEFDTQSRRNEARSTLGSVRKISTPRRRKDRTAQSVKVEAPQAKPGPAVQHNPQTLRYSRPIDDPPTAASCMPASSFTQTQDPPAHPGGRRRRVQPAEVSLSQGSVSRSLEVRMSQPGALSKGKQRSIAVESSLPPSLIAAQSLYPYDDLSTIMSTYQPTPISQSQTSRKSHRQESTQSQPPSQLPSQPPPFPHTLNSLIIAHLRSISATTTTLASLTKTLHTTPSHLSSALNSLSSDGYLIPSGGGWLVVGYPLLRDIIDAEVRAAQKGKAAKVVLVSKVWREAAVLWNGVGKEAVGDVLAGWFKEHEGWTEVRGGWEWKRGVRGR